MSKSQSQKAIDTRKKWLKRINDEGDAHKDWRTLADQAMAAMFVTSLGPSVGNATNTGPKAIVDSYPLFPSTIKIIHGRVFSQPPKPDVRKRYADAGQQTWKQQQSSPAGNPGSAPAAGGMAGAPAPPAGSAGMPPATPQPGMGPSGPQPAPSPAGGQPPPQQVQPTVDDNKLALCIERALNYSIDTTDWDADMHASVNDFLVAACGVGKVEMDTDTEQQPVINPLTGQPVMVHKETGEPAALSEIGEPMIEEGMEGEYEPAMQTVIVDQTTRYRAFSYSQFHWEPKQHWSGVSWVAFDHWMTKTEIEDRFSVTLDTVGGDREGGGTVGGDPKKPQSAKYKDQIIVHEIWNKKAKERLFITEAYEGVLDQEDDPLGLQDFFPCPKPMFLNLRGDDLVPMPDYTYCQLLFEQCNELSNRIGKIIQQIKECGFYDASVPELQSARGNLPDGTYIPIAGLAQRIAQAGGKADGTINSVLARWDNQTAVAVIQELLNITEAFKSRIWEIYGVPDIIRGSSNPNETASAQKIKAQWADVRIGEKVRLIALYCRDVFRIQAELMAEKFETDILEKMTGIELNDLEIQVLRSDYGRCYAIDVESDSTVVQDDAADQEQTMNFVNTMIATAEKLIPAAQQGMMPADIAKEILLTAAGAFKKGRSLEQAINNLPDTTAQLGQMHQQIGTLQQQLKGANDQAQAMQKQLAAVNMGKEQRENAKTASDVQSKQFQNAKTDAETVHTQVLAAAEAQDIHDKQQAPHPVTNVVPIGPGRIA